MFDNDDGFLPGPGLMDMDDLRERIAETRRAAKVCGEFASAQEEMREFLRDYETIGALETGLLRRGGFGPDAATLSESDAELVAAARKAAERGLRSALARYPGAMAELEKFRREQIAKNSDA